MTLGSKTTNKTAAVARATIRALSRLAWGLPRATLPGPQPPQCPLPKSCPHPRAATRTAPVAASVFKAESQRGCHLLGKCVPSIPSLQALLHAPHAPQAAPQPS